MIPARKDDPCPCGSGITFEKCCMKKITSDDDRLAASRAGAYKLMADEQWNDAIAQFKDLLDIVKDPHAVLEAVGACYDGLEDYLRAAEYYEKALAVCPDSKRFDLYYRLGISRACGLRIKKAIDAFSNCMNVQGNSQKHERIRDILQNLAEIQEGRKSSQLFFVQVQLQRVFSEMESERYDLAANRLERLAQIEPENPAIFYNLGVVYTFLRKEDDALAQFTRTVELDPRVAEAWYNMGQICLIKKKDFSKALNCFERAVAARPDYVGAQHQRGMAYELLGDPEKALACWEKTLELDPGNKQAQDNIRRLRPEPASAGSKAGRRKDI